MRPLYIDGNYLAYQSYFAMGDLRTEEAIPTGVLFGFLSRCLDLGHRFRTTELLFCWDSLQSERKQIFPDYKRHRKAKTPDEARRFDVLFEQIERLKRSTLSRVGWSSQFEQPGREADDLLAALSRDEGTIVTADEDLFQMLRPAAVDVWSPRKKRLWTFESFQQEYGIIPQQWAAVKTIAGCSSDNVPGVPGVGEPTAIRWLRDELPVHHKTYAKIEAFLNSPEHGRNKQLVTLPFPGTDKPAVRPSAPTLNGLMAVAEEYQMASFTSGREFDRWAALVGQEFEGPPSSDRRRKSASTRATGIARMKARRRRGFGV
jgi:5'-3' exonuclease